MFNQTIISAVQLLSPLWSEQIVKYFALDFRYCTILTMFFNSFSNVVSFSEYLALQILSGFCIVNIIIYVFKNKINISFPFFKSQNKRQYNFLTQFNSEKRQLLENDNNAIEQFLFENQHFFKTTPKWICGHIASYENKKDIYSTDVLLDDGNYTVYFKEDLEIYISVFLKEVEKQMSKRNFSVLFNKGNIDELFKFITWTESEKKSKQSEIIVYSFPLGLQIAKISYDKNSKGKKDNFKGYYHPKLKFITDWLDNLNTPVKHYQHRQFSILCHGKPGTGKTAITQRIAQYTDRNIININLFQIKKKKQLMELFYCGGAYTDDTIFTFKMDNIIFFIDELDKVVKKFIQLKKIKDKQENQKCIPIEINSSNLASSPSYEVETKKDKDNYDWNLDDLLEIFCGTYVPNKRIIIACCNDLEIIQKECPFLIRPGRLTPILFDYGDKSLFLEILKDQTNLPKEDLSILEENIPNSYQFTHSHIIEFLNSFSQISVADILQNLHTF